MKKKIIKSKTSISVALNQIKSLSIHDNLKIFLTWTSQHTPFH